VRVFVLGGGGKWGATQLGMLGALVEAGIGPDRVLGTSIGAINGAAFATDPTAAGVAALRDAWLSERTRRALSSGWIARARRLASLQPALVPQDAMRELVAGIVPVTSFEELRVPFECVAAHVERARERWFATGPLVEAVMASCAVPGLFAPVEIGGEHYYDGGLVNSVPLDRALELGATEVFVLQVGRSETALKPPRRPHDTAIIAFEIARRHRFASAMAALPDGVAVHLLPSGNPMGQLNWRQLRWSDLGDTDRLIDNARQATSGYLAEHGLA